MQGNFCAPRTQDSTAVSSVPTCASIRHDAGLGSPHPALPQPDNLNDIKAPPVAVQTPEKQWTRPLSARWSAQMTGILAAVLRSAGSLPAQTLTCTSYGHVSGSAHTVKQRFLTIRIRLRQHQHHGGSHMTVETRLPGPRLTWRKVEL